jgi:class 3 adenylate cyclase
MEDAAKAHHVGCVISGDVAQALDHGDSRFLPIGTETIKGISAPIAHFEYRPA